MRQRTQQGTQNFGQHLVDQVHGMEHCLNPKTNGRYLCHQGVELKDMVVLPLGHTILFLVFGQIF